MAAAAALSDAETELMAAAADATAAVAAAAAAERLLSLRFFSHDGAAAAFSPRHRHCLSTRCEPLSPHPALSLCRCRRATVAAPMVAFLFVT